MAIRTNADKLIAKVSKSLARLEPKSAAMNETLNRIGVTLRNRIIMNATQQRIVDTGALRNSLNYRVEGNRVIAGSFGVRYARFHEFGATLSPRAVRGMFAAMGKRSGPKRAGKGVFTGNAQTGGVLRARPFVRPAFDSEKARILAIIQQYAQGG